MLSRLQLLHPARSHFQVGAMHDLRVYGMHLIQDEKRYRTCGDGHSQHLCPRVHPDRLVSPRKQRCEKQVRNDGGQQHEPSAQRHLHQLFENVLLRLA
jgi:hypothetical protein